MSIPRVTNVNNLHIGDFKKDGSKLRLREVVHIINSEEDSSLAYFDSTLPLDGWDQPTGSKINATALVVFQNGIGHYTYDGADWILTAFVEKDFTPLTVEDTWVVPFNAQAFYNIPIQVEGLIVLDGALIEID